MKEIGNKASQMVKENKHLHKGTFMKVFLKMDIKMVKEFLHGQTD